MGSKVLGLFNPFIEQMRLPASRQMGLANKEEHKNYLYSCCSFSIGSAWL